MAAISARRISLNSLAIGARWSAIPISSVNKGTTGIWAWCSGVLPRGWGWPWPEVVYYRNRVENLIRFMQNSQRVSRPHNMGRALLRGVETRVEARLVPRLVLRGNYAYQRAENRTPFSFERGNDLPNAPRHRLNTHASLDLGRAEIYGEFSRESRHFLDRANLRTVPVRALYNLGGSVPLVEGISLSWELRNLTDNQVADLWATRCRAARMGFPCIMM